MSTASTRQHLHDAGTADQKRAQRREQSLTELRALIATSRADLVRTLDDVRTLVDSRRPGVNIGGNAPKGATTPAPVNVGALSVLEETSKYLPDLQARLEQQLRIVGTEVPTPATLDSLVALVDDPDRLRPVHRDLERLAEQAHRVVDGQRRLPEPCPHCRRQTLTVDHDTGITTCGKNPKTGRREPCRCDDRYCPCHHDHTYRHTWSRAARAHTPTSWQGLNRAQKEATVLEEAITRVRDLHAKTPVQPWATDCDAHGHEREYLEAWGESICITCPPIGHICAHCLQLASTGTTPPDPVDGLELVETPADAWPCPTIRALDAPPSAAAAS